MVANDTGIPFEDIEQGKYKLVIEPVIYLVYQNLHFAMTTTEAGLYNQMTGGNLGSHFPTVVMKNHALALFLERSDLGFPAWTGPTGSARTTQEMISTLGIGIISYRKAPETEIAYDKEYRVDTDVIVAVLLTTGSRKTPSSPAYARFTINGITYSHNNIYIPENGSQLAWVKWHTPSEPGDVTITISSNCSTSTGQIRARIVDLDDNPPPDPQADDRYDGFCIPTPPENQDVTQLTWGSGTVGGTHTGYGTAILTSTEKITVPGVIMAGGIMHGSPILHLCMHPFTQSQMRKTLRHTGKP